MHLFPAWLPGAARKKKADRFNALVARHDLNISSAGLKPVAAKCRPASWRAHSAYMGLVKQGQDIIARRIKNDGCGVHPILQTYHQYDC